MQIICASLQTNNFSTSSLNFLQTGCSSWRPTNSVNCQSTENNATGRFRRRQSASLHRTRRKQNIILVDVAGSTWSCDTVACWCDVLVCVDRTLKSHRAVVLLNLCVALIVANVVFLAGVDKTRPTVILDALSHCWRFRCSLRTL